jgi:DNA-binding MarR family transcriptional regulator
VPDTPDELIAVTRGLRRVLRRRLRASRPADGLRGAEIELLVLVDAEPGIGVAAAAESLQLAGNSVSTLVRRLVADGMLERAADPDDRRAVHLRVSPRAAERLRWWRESRRRLVVDALEELDDGERAAITAALPALRHLVEELS